MYVATSARGVGLARAMLVHLERTAREGGAEAMVLETGTAQPEAIALYESAGYDEVPPFNDEPFADRWFAKRLRESGEI
jgi:ribosomal protein S18 acetylase RimI-like enzyme